MCLHTMKIGDIKREKIKQNIKIKKTHRSLRELEDESRLAVIEA